MLIKRLLVNIQIKIIPKLPSQSVGTPIKSIFLKKKNTPLNFGERYEYRTLGPFKKIVQNLEVINALRVNPCDKHRNLGLRFTTLGEY